jgi:tetratricopeptide (TPR) repeat protein
MDDYQPRITTEIHQARQIMLAGNPEDALARLANVDGEFATLALVRGECFYLLRRFTEAKREFARCLLLAPNSPRAEIMLEIASDMAELDRTIRPRATIDQLLGEADPLDIVPAFNTQFDIGDESEENDTENFSRMDEIANPSSGETGLVSETLAELMESQGRNDDARNVYIQLSHLNPDRAEYYREKIERLGANMNYE